MSELTDFLAEIEADKEAVAQFAAKLAATGQLLEAAKARASELGANDVVARIARVEAEVEQVETGRAVLEGSLEKARIQVDAAIYGNPIGSPGGGSKTAPEGLDAVPPHVRHGRKPSGDELMGNDPTIGPFQKEHENADRDRGSSPFQRGARSAVRNVEELKDAADQLAKPSYIEMEDVWKPPASTYPSVGTPEPISTFTPPPTPHADVQNHVGNLVVFAVLVTEWAARGIKKRRR